MSKATQTLDLQIRAEQLNQINSEHASQRERPSKAMASPEFTSNAMPNVWVYDGEAYDLTDFMKRHPGGEFFIGRMKNRDITAVVNIFHSNPAKVKKMLQKYALGRSAVPEDLHPKYNAPPFLFCDTFDGRLDTPKFNFETQAQLLDRIRVRLNVPEMREKIARADFIFDAVTVTLGILYILVQVLRLTAVQCMPLYGFVPLMVMLRISLAGAGHYYNHRPQVRLNKFFAHVFDINYVPMSFVVIDGHSLMHHPYTQSKADVKTNVFTAMMELPRYYRVPLHTLHKLAHVLTGMLVRTVEISSYAVRFGVHNFYGNWQRGLLHYVGMAFMRVLLLGELILFTLHGDLIAWLAQFVLTTWLSTFLIVASHDFEVDESVETEQIAEQDWAVFQINSSYDLTMIGNPYIDCFLSAGLSPHRVHHVLPYQRSGFANVLSEEIVREEAEKLGVSWLAPKNFFYDRLPLLVKHYLLEQSRMADEKNFGLLKEHFHPKALTTSFNYILKGFAGIGSI
jgi:Cytochrome b5-like Heme/Steroid binding domain